MNQKVEYKVEEVPKVVEVKKSSSSSSSEEVMEDDKTIGIKIEEPKIKIELKVDAVKTGNETETVSEIKADDDYFADLSIWEGYKGVYPRLIRISGEKQDIDTTLLPCLPKSINRTDCFILDCENKIFQLNNKGSMFEKRKANDVARALNDERNGKCHVEVVDDGHDEEFWAILGGKPDSIPENADTPNRPAELYHIGEHEGKVSYNKLGTGKGIKKSMLNTNDVMLLDTGFGLFVWEGKKCTPSEREHGMQFARRFVRESHRPPTYEIIRSKEGGENELFKLYCKN